MTIFIIITLCHIFSITNIGLIMPITTDIDIDNQLTIHTGIGDSFFIDLMITLKKVNEGQQTKNVLWDFRKSVFDMTDEDVNALTTYVKFHSKKLSESKSAVVVLEDTVYEIARKIKTVGGTKGFPFQMEVFRSYEEAIQWLDEE